MPVKKYYLRTLIIAMGFTAIITQIVLLREFISVFSGNELVMGILLSNWMLLTGAGAYSGKYFETSASSIYKVLWLHFITSLLPAGILFVLSYTRYLFFPFGLDLNLFQVFYYSALIILPFCFFSGLLFTQYSALFSDALKGNLIKNVYALESTGSIIGGLIFNLAFIFLLNTAESLLLVSAINLLVILFAIHIYKKLLLKLFSVAFLLLILGLFFTDPEYHRLSMLFPGQHITDMAESPYGRIITTTDQGQLNVYENGGLLYTNDNRIENEENVHYLMPQISDPDTVAVISGNFTGVLQEIMKYDIEHIDYIEMNPRLFEITQKAAGTSFTSQDNVELIHSDPILYLSETDKKYDAIMINLPDPSTAQLNRYYTRGFFNELKAHLTDQGAAAISLSAFGNYLGEEARLLFSSIYNTANEVFRYVTVIPGNRIYFLLSDQPKGFGFLKALQQKNIKTDYVSDYSDTVLMKLRSKRLLESIDQDAPLNEDFRPVAYFYHIKYWLSDASFSTRHLLAIVLFLILAAFMFFNAYNFGLFAGGFAASSIEFIILISFQIIYGYIYQFIGLIVTCFMAGLVFGAIYLVKKIGKTGRSKFSMIQAVISLYAIFIPLIMLVLKQTSSSVWLVQTLIFLLTFLVGTITGLQYSIATEIREKPIRITAAKTYGADMLGSAAGALIAAVYLVPVAGIVNAGIAIGSLNLLAYLNIQFRK